MTELVRNVLATDRGPSAETDVSAADMATLVATVFEDEEPLPPEARSAPVFVPLTTPRFERLNQPEKGLQLTCDRKVSVGYAFFRNGKGRVDYVATLPNSLGLTAGDSCPGKTSFCGACYAANAENMKGVGARVDHNLRLLMEAGTEDNMAALLKDALAIYVAEVERIQQLPEEQFFRIHWDGDFFSETYARAWVQAIRTYPQVRFLAYTRSFRAPVNVVPTLMEAGLDNLVLYLSTDADNVEDAQGMLARYPTLLLARCADTYENARALAPERPSTICPENSGVLPLMSEGKGAPVGSRACVGKGACVKCRLCPRGLRDVLFSSNAHSGKRNTQLPLFAPESRVGKPTGAVCALPGCEEPVRFTSDKGRPPTYHQKECRWAARFAKAAPPLGTVAVETELI